MALEPQIKEIEVNYSKKIGEKTFGVSVMLSTNGEKIEKVLYTKNLVEIDKVIVNNGNLQIDGIVNASALAKLENGEIVELKGSTNFSQTLSSQVFVEGLKVFVEPKVLGVQNMMVNDKNLSYVQEIFINIFACEKQKVKYVEGLNKANQKMCNIKYQSITNYQTENFEIGTEIDLPTSISKILACDSFVNAKESICQKDIVSIDGEIYTNVVYLTNDENPKLKNQSYVSDFHQECLIPGVDENQIATAFLNTVSNGYNVVGEMNNKGMLELKNKVSANITTRGNFEIESVLDAFCPIKELNLEYSSFQNEQVVFKKHYVEKIDGSYVLDSDSSIDKVLFCSKGIAKVDSVQKNENNIFIKGTVEVFVVYVLDDENFKMQSVNILVPFESRCTYDELCGDDLLFVDVQIKDVEARNKRAKEIDAIIDVAINVVVSKKNDEVVVSNVTVGEDRKQDLCSMGIYVINSANNCWEVAKKLLVSPDVLMEQNKDLAFPITKPTQIVVYRQKMFEN